MSIELYIVLLLAIHCAWDIAIALIIRSWHQGPQKDGDWDEEEDEFGLF